jgi:hypothetical protein
MSHFTVGVITDDLNKVRELLAPYQENNMGDCPMKYMEFHSLSKEYKDKYENDTTKMVKLSDGTLINTYDERCYRIVTKEEYEEAKKEKGKETSYSSWPEEVYKIKDLSVINGELCDVPWKQLYPTIKEYLEDYHDAKYDEKQQDWGYWENPNRKWDWYQLGGRWSGSLLIKSESEGKLGSKGLMGSCDHDENDNTEDERWVDCAQIKDVLWDKMLEKEKEHLAKQYDKVMNDENERKYAAWMYDIEDGMTKEEYVEDASRFSTFAVITPDGKWHEKGQMGWWACVSNEDENWKDDYYEAFIKDTNPEYWLIVVDCHI